LRADQVSQVRGFADQHLRNKKNPQDPSNRRISIIVQYIDRDAEAAEQMENAAQEIGARMPAAQSSATRTKEGVAPDSSKK
jgi:hypothetical protein